MDNIIKELKLQLGEKEVSLSMGEAERLAEAFDDLFDHLRIEIMGDNVNRTWFERNWCSTVPPDVPLETMLATCKATFETETKRMTLKVT